MGDKRSAPDVSDVYDDNDDSCQGRDKGAVTVGPKLAHISSNVVDINPCVVSTNMGPSNVEAVLEPLFVFLVTDRRFVEVSHLTVVSWSWRTVVLKSLKTVTQIDLIGFVESVWDEGVRLALVRVTSENLKRVDLTSCQNISPGCIENILQYMTETCSSVKEVYVTSCSNEAVLWDVVIRE